MTYADDGNTVILNRWLLNSTNYIQTVVQTNGSYVGRLRFTQRESTSGYVEIGTTGSYFTPGTNVPFKFASRHGSAFINAAEGGTALTADTTPTALPDLSNVDFILGAYYYMGTIGKFVVWNEDIGDTGIASASL